MPNKFDNNIYKQLVNSRDYSGAADYLESFEIKQEYVQEYYDEIENLRRHASIQAGILEKMKPDAQQAYHFVNAINGNGNIPHQQYDEQGNAIQNTANKWGDEYTGLFNDLSVKNEHGIRNHVSNLQVELKSNNVLNTLLTNLNVRDINEAEDLYGIKITKDYRNGYTTFDIPLDNKKLTDILSSVNNIETFSPYRVTSLGYNVAPIGSNNDDKQFSIYAVADGKKYDRFDPNVNYENVNKAIKLVRDARNLQQVEFDKNATADTIEDLYISEYYGLGHANAVDKYNKGFIDSTELNRIVERRKESYDRLIMGLDPNLFEIYAYNKDQTALEKVTDPKALREIRNDIQLALQDKRLTYHLGMMGSDYGTSFDVGEKSGKNVDVTKDTRRYFIKDFLKESCKELFEKDSKTLALRDANDLRKWNYGTKLHDGTFIGHDKVIGYYTTDTDDYGNEFKIPITKDDALRALNKQNITKQAVRSVLSKLNSDGTPQNEIRNGKVVPIDIENRLTGMVNSAINELYPAEQYSYDKRFLEANDLLQTIKRLTRYKINDNQDNIE